MGYRNDCGGRVGWQPITPGPVPPFQSLPRCKLVGYDVMIEVTLLGTGSPMVDANRAGPSTLVRAGEQIFLVDCGRGVLQRAAAVGVGAAGITALLLTHLHSDHIGDLGDLLITRWITTFTPEPSPLPIIGPPGTAEMVEATLKAFGHDIGYRLAHHADLNAPPAVDVREYTEGPVWDR